MRGSARSAGRGYPRSGGNAAAALDATDVDRLFEAVGVIYSPGHRQPADIGNGFDWRSGRIQVGHDDGEQQTDRPRPRTAASNCRCGRGSKRRRPVREYRRRPSEAIHQRARSAGVVARDVHRRGPQRRDRKAEKEHRDYEAGHPDNHVVEEDHRHQPRHGENPAAGNHQGTRNLQAPVRRSRASVVIPPISSARETRRTAAPCKGMPIS